MRIVNKIHVDHKELYNATVDVVYDIISDKQFGTFESKLIEAFISPDKFIASIRDGNTMMHMAKQHQIIEAFVKENVSFIVVVWKNDKIWAVVNGEDVNY